MIGIQDLRDLGDRDVLVADEMNLFQPADQEFSKALDPVALEGGQQDQRYCGKVDQPADADKPASSC